MKLIICIIVKPTFTNCAITVIKAMGVIWIANYTIMDGVILLFLDFMKSTLLENNFLSLL